MTERWTLDWGSLAAGAGAVLAAVDARGAGGRGLGAHHTLHRRLGTVELADQLEVAEWVLHQDNRETAITTSTYYSPVELVRQFKVAEYVGLHNRFEITK